MRGLHKIKPYNPTITYRDDGAVAMVLGEATILFDATDAPTILQYRWRIDVRDGGLRSYVHATSRFDRAQFKSPLRMHRLLMGGGPRLVDHANGNGLDNRRCNLRMCTPADNARNRRKSRPTTSAFKGVGRYRGRLRRPWHAKLKVQRQEHFIGCFATEEEAARAYDMAAKKHFGEFANLNFPNAGRGLV